jgi:AraC family transcriptional regulator, regulatory protein of adaptative response / methylated-DNA-[protein]-cysteine methyltransferase
MPRRPVPPRDAPATVPDETRWAAVAARDGSCEGSFVYSVATTGVYCRPSCPARPKRENVRFHATWADAEAAGFRPCKRCKPRGEPLP